MKDEIIRLLLKCHSDIGDWVELANAQRDDLDDPDNEPNTPSLDGIRYSENLLKTIGKLIERLKGRGDATMHDLR